ncbi:UNVERIFIED_CONTAM: Chavicol O-methyltransferase [Sesamum radiatum]|uniref:Chavicol O-methyltransferase n=1 Tax=Sesamum radiatum TaxID=300843 RepID=A0AAW2LQY4_SESRA
MAFQNGELSTEQLLHAQAHVWNHLFSFINSMSLKCAIQLGIPDIIHNHAKPISLSQLLDALSIPKAKSHFVYRLMRILIHSGFFVKVDISNDDDEEEKEHYWLTPASLLLLRNAPLSVAPLVQLILDPNMTEPFDHLRQQPGLNNLYNDATSSDSRLLTHVLVRDYKQVFEGIKSLVDVGGGTGTTAKAIADAFPDMKCIVLDLPHVVGGLEGTNNFTYVAGDMFETIPSADAVFLKWILHDWNDEDCVKILKKCKEAIAIDNKKGGKVIIIDMVLDVQGIDNEVRETHLLLDITVLGYYNGKERTEKEFAKLFLDAGFTSYKITPAFGMRSLIEIYP